MNRAPVDVFVCRPLSFRFFSFSSSLSCCMDRLLRPHGVVRVHLFVASFVLFCFPGEMTNLTSTLFLLLKSGRIFFNSFCCFVSRNNCVLNEWILCVFGLSRHRTETSGTLMPTEWTRRRRRDSITWARPDLVPAPFCPTCSLRYDVI